MAPTMMITNSKSALPPTPLREAAEPSVLLLLSLDWLLRWADAGFISGLAVADDVAPGLSVGFDPGWEGDFAASGFAPDCVLDFVPVWVSVWAAVGFDAGFASELALPLLSTEMVSVDFWVSTGFAEASDFGVSGFFTIGPLQFAVVP